jgi:hypothetical protein
MREMSMALRYSTPDNTCWLCCLYSSSSPSATDGARAGGGDKRRKGESTVLSQRCVGCWCGEVNGFSSNGKLTPKELSTNNLKE